MPFVVNADDVRSETKANACQALLQAGTGVNGLIKRTI